MVRESPRLAGRARFPSYLPSGFAISKPDKGWMGNPNTQAGCFGRDNQKNSSDDLAVAACRWCRWYLYRPSYLWYLSYDSDRMGLLGRTALAFTLRTLPISLSPCPHPNVGRVFPGSSTRPHHKTLSSSKQLRFQTWV